ncbi:MAG TPA: secretion protein HlyD, partial [Ruminococcaceae bacterium]|nr:secretion protein HlyD [Oscillospiraceae bacterium]
LLKKQIDQKLTLLLTAVQEQDYSGVPEARSNLLYLLNERQIVTGKSKDYSSRIAELQKQLQSASPSGGKTGQIKSPAAGYFINSADGYEEKWDYASVPGLSASQLREKLSQKPAAVPSGVVGKVCEEFGWYFACVVPPDEALKFKEGQRVSIRLPFAVSEDVPATVAAVNQKDRQSEAALVLQSSYMDQEIASIRNETVQIQAGS